MPADLQQQIRERLFMPLARLRTRTRLYVLLGGLARLVLAMLLTGLLQLGIDWWFRLTVDQRAIINAMITAVWLLVFYRYLLRPLLSRLPDRLLASWVDRAHPALHDHLTTAVEFAEGQRELPAAGSDSAVTATNSPELVRSVLGDACRVSASLRFTDVLDHRRAGMLGLGAASILMLIAVAFAVMPDTMNTWFRRNWFLEDLAWRQKTYLVLQGFDESRRRRFPRGDELEIVAVVRADSQAPDTANLIWWTDSGRKGRETMTRMGASRFEVSLGPVSENIHFRIVGGDERTAEHVVEAVDRPRIVHTVARIAAPQYTRLDPVELPQQTVFEILSGSTLELRATVNKPLKEAHFLAADGTPVPCEVEMLESPEGPVILARWRSPESGAYRFELVDADGWNNRNPVRYSLKVTPDRAPRVQLQANAVGDVVTPRAEFSVDVRVEDTYGLGSAELVTQRGDDPPQARPLSELRPAMRQLQAMLPVQVATAAARPGDRLRLGARAADLDPRGPNVGEATGIDLRVLSAEDFMAEMGRREFELRREFETLIAAQRSIEESLARVEPAGPGAAAANQQLAALVRRQAAHAGRCLSFAQRFEQILVEMRTSRVARPADERRISERIVEPLAVLGRETVPVAAEALAGFRRNLTDSQRAAATAAQAEVLKQMRAVLANMLEWEGYREAVTLLQEIIAAQGSIRSETVAALERQLRDILEITDPEESPLPAESKP